MHGTTSFQLAVCSCLDAHFSYSGPNQVIERHNAVNVSTLRVRVLPSFASQRHRKSAIHIAQVSVDLGEFGIALGGPCKDEVLHSCFGPCGSLQATWHLGAIFQRPRPHQA
jgi:hypothetical protein